MERKEKPRKRSEAYKQMLQARQQASQTDPQGSWTGVPWDEDDQPVQDADDL